MFLANFIKKVSDFFKWTGDPNNINHFKEVVDNVIVRDTTNFNWTFIFILCVVFYIYWTEIKNKNWQVVQAGLALYGVHWLYEIFNAVHGYFYYPLWTVSNDSTTFILLIGVCWELSMMFSVAGMISFKMLGDNPEKRYFAKGKFKGISAKLVGAIEMAALFALFEAFLAATNGGNTFIWVYPAWGVFPVFITTYVPFFLAANFVPFMKPKAKKIFLIVEWALVALLLAILIPLGII